MVVAQGVGGGLLEREEMVAALEAAEAGKLGLRRSA